MKVECMIHTCESDAEVIEVSMCSLIKVQVHVRQKLLEMEPLRRSKLTNYLEQ